MKIIIIFLCVDSISVSTPSVSLTIPDTLLYAGRVVSVTCSATISSVVDTSIFVNVTWLREGRVLSNETRRVSISPTLNNLSSFNSILTLSPLIDTDNTIFSCEAMAYSYDGFITNSSVNKMGIFIPVIVLS